MVETGDKITFLQSQVAGLKQALAELRLIGRIAQEVCGSDSVDEINERILTMCVRHFDAEQGAIHLICPCDQQAVLRTEVRAKTAVRVRQNSGVLPVRLGIGLTGWVAKYHRPLLSNDLPCDPRFSGASAEAPHIHSVLAVPLRTHSAFIGILTLFNKRAPSGFEEEDQRVLCIIGGYSAQLIENAQLHAKQKQRDEELLAAAVIQRGLLPQCPPRIAGLEACGYSLPAREVGGDYFDWAPLPDGRLGCVLADVSGKGIASAILMAQLQAAFKAQLQVDASPAAALDGINRFLAQSMETDRFVTMFYGVADPNAHSLTWACAGHNPPCVVGSDGAIRSLEGGGMLLSRVSRLPYVQLTTPFEKGDTLIVYSDGVTDAEAPDGRQWGIDGLRAVISQSVGLNPHDLAERIRQLLRQHVGDAEQFDDITMAIVHHT